MEHASDTLTLTHTRKHTHTNTNTQSRPYAARSQRSKLHFSSLLYHAALPLSVFFSLSLSLSILRSLSSRFSLYAIAVGSSTLKPNAKFVENPHKHTHTNYIHTRYIYIYADADSDLVSHAEHKEKVLKTASRPTAETERE